MVIFYFFALSFFFAVTALSIFWETLHPVFSTAFNLLMLGAFIYAVFYKKILKGVNIAYVSAISVLMLSWSFFFIRKEGIVSWTYYLRQTHGLKVSLLEIEEAQRIADEAEQEEKAKALQALAVKQKKKQKAAAAKKKKERAKLEAQAKSKEQATDKDLSSKKNEPSGDNADENDDLFSKLPLNGSSLPGFNPDGTPSNSKGSDGSQDTDKKATSDVTSPLSFASTSLIAVGCVLIFA